LASLSLTIPQSPHKGAQVSVRNLLLALFSAHLVNLC
jgi:hypothetical protein